jgi:hypothetical protein
MKRLANCVLFFAFGLTIGLVITNIGFYQQHVHLDYAGSKSVNVAFAVLIAGMLGSAVYFCNAGIESWKFDLMAYTATGTLLFLCLEFMIVSANIGTIITMIITFAALLLGLIIFLPTDGKDVPRWLKSLRQNA